MKAYIAEAIGTFALVFVGVGAISNQPFGGDLLMVALAYGLTVAVFASATAAISGGHLNPAITLGVWLAGKIRGPEALRYGFAQLTGAVLAGFAAKYLFGDVAVLKGSVKDNPQRYRNEIPEVPFALGGGVSNPYHSCSRMKSSPPAFPGLSFGPAM